MEPTFEQKSSAEFDTHSHHIFKAEDVVFVLSEIDEEPEYGVVSDMEYLQWVYDVLTRREGFGLEGILRDVQALNAISDNSEGNIYEKHASKLLEIATEMAKSYEEETYKIVKELNGFLSKNPGLFLWSAEPKDTIDEISIETGHYGNLQPLLKSEELFIDISLLNENYHALVAKELSAV